MHYGQIFLADTSNGVGIRLTLFVSGCTIHCEGCFQPETWNFDYGKPYTEETEQFIIDELQKSHYTGLTILGGEPFEPSNQRELVKLIRRVRGEVPERTIWMYTGFVYDQDLIPGGKRYTEVTDEILDNIDTLVDGPFMLGKKRITLNFRGSENQRIIDMAKTRESRREALLSGGILPSPGDLPVVLDRRNN